MDEAERQSDLMSALTTEHFVLQTAASSTISEAASRSSLYVYTLSGSLVAFGFTSQSRDIFMPFVATVLPVVFLLGVFTVLRLIDTALENMQYLTGIARIRSYYRSLGPEGMKYFMAQSGRWPEATPPSLRLGSIIAFVGTSATMIAVINHIVAGVLVTLAVNAVLGGNHLYVALACGVVSVGVLTLLFLWFQRWRFDQNQKELDGAQQAASR